MTDYRLHAEPGHYRIDFNPDVRLWAAHHYAGAWYTDAKESIAAFDRNGRPREILFSVCCAESYLVEWAINVTNTTGEHAAPAGEVRRHVTAKIAEDAKDYGVARTVPKSNGHFAKAIYRMAPALLGVHGITVKKVKANGARQIEFKTGTVNGGQGQ